MKSKWMRPACTVSLLFVCLLGISCDPVICGDGVCGVGEILLCSPPTDCVPPNPCADVTCPDGQECVDGDCVPVHACADVTCEDDQECVDGECQDIVDDPCADVTCEDGQECVEGVCVAIDLCADVTCADGEICDAGTGECGADLCADVTCEDDGLFCTGTEACDGETGECASSGDPCDTAGGFTCNEDTGECDPPVACLDDTECPDDRLFCNGTESCVDGACVSSGDPCAESETCDEDTDACVDLCSAVVCLEGEVCDAATGDCVELCSVVDCLDDGMFCNGTEECDPDTGECLSSGDPCEQNETCDEDADECIPACELATLTGSDAQPGDHFGASVSIQGGFVVVGSKVGTGSGATHPGTTYVFEREGPAWNEIARLTAPDGEANDWFGASVSFSGDIVFVGAALDTTPAGSRAGSVYVFQKPLNGWETMSEATKLTASDAAPNDWFGSVLSADGDYAIVGSLRDDDAGSESGSAYIFHQSESMWNEVAKLIASDAAPGDNFGSSVFIDGDLVVVGAPHDDTAGGADAGSAYIYQRSGSTWNEVARLAPDDAASGANFGLSVSINGGVVIVGSRDNANGVQDAGSAYIFEPSGPTWVQTAKLIASNPTASNELGNAVTINGDLAVVGAARNGGAPGSAYLFVKPLTGWEDMTENDELLGASENDRFGEALAIDGAFLIVGAQLNDSVGADAGAAYVLCLPMTDGD